MTKKERPPGLSFPKTPNLEKNTVSCTKESLVQVVARSGGLSAGSHHARSGKFCILEAVSVCEGREWTSDPLILDRPDVRLLNDALWPDDVVRTEQMLRLAPLLEAWPGWGDEKRVVWVRGVALRTAREILPIALRAAKIDEALVFACEQAKDLVAASYASDASRAASYTRYAARYAANAARYASDAASAANFAKYAESSVASYAVLALAVTIWAEEAEKAA